MKIAINCAFYEPKGGGVKEYIDNLVTNLATLPTRHEFVLYVLQDQLDYARNNLPSKFKIKTLPFNSGSKINKIKRSLFEGSFWRKEEKEEKFELFHSPFFHAPKLKKAKILLTVHDLRLYRFPETYEFFRYQFLKRKVKNSIKNAEHIISISEFTKNEIKELCGVSEDNITVIHEAINQERFSANSITDPEDVSEDLKNNPFILSVGHMEPRKNYDRLIEAFVKMKEKPEFKDLRLVIVGKKDHSYEATIKKIEATPDISYLNFVSENTLLWLYKHARLFVFPSYYEGFGFPPLEAAALGTISAVSNVSSIPEVCGGGVFYFNPYDVEEMDRVIESALTNTNLAKEMQMKISERLNQLSWERNAKETLTVYSKLSAN